MHEAGIHNYLNPMCAMKMRMHPIVCSSVNQHVRGSKAATSLFPLTKGPSTSHEYIWVVVPCTYCSCKGLLLSAFERLLFAGTLPSEWGTVGSWPQLQSFNLRSMRLRGERSRIFPLFVYCKRHVQELELTLQRLRSCFVQADGGR